MTPFNKTAGGKTIPQQPTAQHKMPFANSLCEKHKCNKLSKHLRIMQGILPHERMQQFKAAKVYAQKSLTISPTSRVMQGSLQ
jgi:hypothetical protein